MTARCGSGSPTARIMLVGDCWSSYEDQSLEPFSGPAGVELNKMLHEARIMRSECYATSLINARPPRDDIGAWIATKKKDVTRAHVALRERQVLPCIVEGYQSLLREIDLIKPHVIIALGPWSMWALTGESGIKKWRGSQLETLSTHYKCIPTYHPTYVLRDWAARAITVNDLKRAAKEAHTPHYSNIPKWNFHVRPNFSSCLCTLTDLYNRAKAGELWIDVDIETRGGHIACFGISWSRVDALCIPLMCIEDLEGYWNAQEEARIVWMLKQLLTHPNVKCRLQNGLYDCQYTYRSWGWIPNVGQDTMISQHTCFAALPKSLAYIASMYADYYVYWKDEGKTWAAELNEDQEWSYNLKDCVYTREAGEVLQQTVKALRLEEVERTQQSLFYPVLKAMIKGIRVIPEAKAKLAFDVQEELSKREAFLYRVLGHPINVSSPLQMQTLFYEDLGQKPVLTRTVAGNHSFMRPTVNDEALSTIATREQLLRPVCNAIADIRTLGKLLNDFILMPVDRDKRMRCSFNIAGDAGGKSAPYSYRLSSSKNAFGSGGNLQTIPSQKSKSMGKAAKRGSMSFALPDIRCMYGPDPGFTMFDMDLDRADLQVVVWEIDDEMLKAALHMGADIHLLNVFALDGVDPPPLEELVETHPRYADHRGPRKHKREFAKVFCHATNYVGSPRTIAGHTGRTVHEVDTAQKKWFGAHPGVKLWHKRVEEQIQKRRYVENAFGYRWYIFDRLDGLLPEAVAWIPQSTVGNVINKAWLNIDANMPETHVLVQVHDSLVGEFPTHRRAHCLEGLKKNSQILIPYDDPLYIPVGIKTSEVSWGDCE